MSDRVQDLLDHMADQLAGDLTPPPLARAGRREPATRRHRLLPAAAVAAVLLVVAVAAFGATRVSGDSTRTRYAGASPELGTVELPPDVLGSGLFEALEGRHGQPQGPGHVLARLATRKGEGVLAAQPLATGHLCVTFVYLPPAVNTGFGTSCTNPPADDPPLADGALTISGQGRGGAPGGIKDPAVAYGAAPPGTRTVELSGRGADPVRVPARDAGDRYDHRAYYAAAWDLGAGATVVRALDEEGRELARVERPAPTRNPAFECDGMLTQVLRSHFGRASRVGEKYARTHPESADDRRLAYPASPLTTAAATARFNYARTQISRMGPEETYDYRLASNVVLGEAHCFPDPALQEAARLFKQDSA